MAWNPIDRILITLHNSYNILISKKNFMEKKRMRVIRMVKITSITEMPIRITAQDRMDLLIRHNFFRLFSNSNKSSINNSIYISKYQFISNNSNRCKHNSK